MNNEDDRPPVQHPGERKDGMKVLGVRVNTDLYKLIKRAAYSREMSMADHVRDVLSSGSKHYLSVKRENG